MMPMRLPRISDHVESIPYTVYVCQCAEMLPAAVWSPASGVGDAIVPLLQRVTPTTTINLANLLVTRLARSILKIEGGPMATTINLTMSPIIKPAMLEVEKGQLSTSPLA